MRGSEEGKEKFEGRGVSVGNKDDKILPEVSSWEHLPDKDVLKENNRSCLNG